MFSLIFILSAMVIVPVVAWTYLFINWSAISATTLSPWIYTYTIAQIYNVMDFVIFWLPNYVIAGYYKV